MMGIADIARIHMVVLAFLAGGLLVGISVFEKAWNDVQGRGSMQNTAAGADDKEEKTD